MQKEKFGLYLILTDPVSGYEACAKAAVECGVRYLQLRMKNSPRPGIIETARRLRDITRGSETRLIINDDLTIAMEADADGIHLGQDDLSIQEARKQWNIAGKLFGLSTHSREQEEAARKILPDYIGVGPIYPTPTKSDTAPALGPHETGQIISRSPLTTVAIGGINEENLPSLLDEGIVNFCVVRAVNQAKDPAVAIRRLQNIWKQIIF